MSEFGDFHDIVQEGISDMRYVGNALKFWALSKAYDKLIAFVKEARSHEGLSAEIIRAPYLLTNFVSHLQAYRQDHIDVRANTIFSPSVVSQPDAWRDWQRAGYSTKRTEANYPARLLVFIDIFDKGYTTRSGKVVYYRDVIASRFANSADSDRVPYWYLWNYGNLSTDPGYPSYPGLHFIERAEEYIPEFLNQAAAYLEEYASSVVAGRPRIPSVIRTKASRRSHVVDESPVDHGDYDVDYGEDYMYGD